MQDRILATLSLPFWRTTFSLNQLKIWQNFMAQLTAEICAYDHHSPLTVQALNFFASCVSDKCLVTWSSQVHKQKSR